MESFNLKFCRQFSIFWFGPVFMHTKEPIFIDQKSKSIDHALQKLTRIKLKSKNLLPHHIPHNNIQMILEHFPIDILFIDISTNFNSTQHTRQSSWDS